MTLQVGDRVLVVAERSRLYGQHGTIEWVADLQPGRVGVRLDFDPSQRLGFWEPELRKITETVQEGPRNG